jgi:hypothetical protein
MLFRRLSYYTSIPVFGAVKFVKRAEVRNKVVGMETG